MKTCFVPEVSKFPRRVQTGDDTYALPVAADDRMPAENIVSNCVSRVSGRTGLIGKIPHLPIFSCMIEIKRHAVRR